MPGIEEHILGCPNRSLATVQTDGLTFGIQRELSKLNYILIKEILHKCNIDDHEGRARKISWLCSFPFFLCKPVHLKVGVIRIFQCVPC